MTKVCQNQIKVMLSDRIYPSASGVRIDDAFLKMQRQSGSQTYRQMNDQTDRQTEGFTI